MERSLAALTHHAQEETISSPVPERENLLDARPHDAFLEGAYDTSTVALRYEKRSRKKE